MLSWPTPDRRGDAVGVDAASWPGLRRAGRPSSRRGRAGSRWSAEAGDGVHLLTRLDHGWVSPAGSGREGDSGHHPDDGEGDRPPARRPASPAMTMTRPSTPEACGDADGDGGCRPSRRHRRRWARRPRRPRARARAVPRRSRWSARSRGAGWRPARDRPGPVAPPGPGRAPSTYVGGPVGVGQPGVGGRVARRGARHATRHGLLTMRSRPVSVRVRNHHAPSRAVPKPPIRRPWKSPPHQGRRRAPRCRSRRAGRSSRRHRPSAPARPRGCRARRA